MEFKKIFVFYYFFVSWYCISLGFHIDLENPNLEIHLPFGFIKIGWEKTNEIVNKTIKKNYPFKIFHFKEIKNIDNEK